MFPSIPMDKPLDPGKSLARIDLPIRDVLRFIIPGGYGAISGAIIDHLLFHDALGLANSSLLVPAGFIFGLIAFVGSFHSRLRPWKRRWHREMDAIAKEINAITGHELARREEFAKPIYKLWIEAVCVGDLRGYLHYKTGLYYSMVAVSVYSVAAAAISFLWLIAQAVVAFNGAGYVEPIRFLCTSDSFAGAVCLGGFCIVGRISYTMSKKTLDEVTRQGRIAMELDTSRNELFRLARAATKMAADSEGALAVKEIVKDVVLEVCPGDLQLIESISLDGIIDQLDVRNGEERRVAHVTITSKNPVELNGGPNLYEGERQRILEMNLALRVCAPLNVDAVRIQMEPIGDFSESNYQPLNKQIQAIGLTEALKLKVITIDSPIKECCDRYGINKILVRGRYVVGPSVGLAEVLEHELTTMATGLRVFDPFAGTCLVEKICKRKDPATIVISQDRIDPDGKMVAFDSFAVPIPTQNYDLAIIDPLYEDCLAYLEFVSNKLHAKKWIVQSGRACDIGWNAKIGKVLQKFGSVERPEVNTHGCCFFLVTTS
jgi:hypothetical protein